MRAIHDIYSARRRAMRYVYSPIRAVKYVKESGRYLRFSVGISGIFDREFGGFTCCFCVLAYNTCKIRRNMSGGDSV